MEILCDTCLFHKGEQNKMSGPRAMRWRFGARFEKGDIVYYCDTGCNRYYEPRHGYFSLSDQGDISAEPQANPICQCHEVNLMYIADAGADATVRYVCPSCSAEAIKRIPLLQEKAI